MTRYRKLKWLSLILAGLFVAVALASTQYDFYLFSQSGMVGFYGGCIMVIAGRPSANASLPPIWSFRRARNAILWHPKVIPAGSFSPGTGTIVLVPLWIPTLVALAAAWFFHRKTRVSIAGHCKKCGYNLAGNTSGVCPECGTKA